ncbi:MAG: Fic family protein [Clostridia bacterium]|nr:Fic family protein [Clostridia bacterium]
MTYVSVKEMAEKWGLTDRSVRKYCADGKIPGAFLTGKTWNVPADSQKPERSKRKSSGLRTLLCVLKEQKEGNLSGGIYHRVQIDLTYNSNHMEGSMLTHDQTRYIFETNTVGMSGESIKVDDIIETTNHFRCIDSVIDNAGYELSEKYIKELHRILKSGTGDSRKDWFRVGEYKKLPNEVGGAETVAPENVHAEIRKLLDAYNSKKQVVLDDIIDFHVRFERIHPFQDGNGRIGRLIMFKECLKHNITPFIIDEQHKMFYYRGLAEWHREKGFLRDTILACQDKFYEILMYFRLV